MRRRCLKTDNEPLTPRFQTSFQSSRLFVSNIIRFAIRSVYISDSPHKPRIHIDGAVYRVATEFPSLFHCVSQKTQRWKAPILQVLRQKVFTAPCVTIFFEVCVFQICLPRNFPACQLPPARSPLATALRQNCNPGPCRPQHCGPRYALQPSISAQNSTPAVFPGSSAGIPGIAGLDGSSVETWKTRVGGKERRADSGSPEPVSGTVAANRCRIL